MTTITSWNTNILLSQSETQFASNQSAFSLWISTLMYPFLPCCLQYPRKCSVWYPPPLSSKISSALFVSCTLFLPHAFVSRSSLIRYHSPWNFRHSRSWIRFLSFGLHSQGFWHSVKCLYHLKEYYLRITLMKWNKFTFDLFHSNRDLRCYNIFKRTRTAIFAFIMFIWSIEPIFAAT